MQMNKVGSLSSERSRDAWQLEAGKLFVEGNQVLHLM